MKNFWLGTSVLALLLTSCSQNEVMETVVGGDPDAISFDVTTGKVGTRADDSDVYSLQAKGFAVFATNTGVDGTMVPYIDNKSYKYVSSTWMWDLATDAIPKWTGAKFPMNFYAYFPKSLTPLTIANLEEYPVSIQEVGKQVDMLIAYKKEVRFKPTSSTVPFSFQHILSKVQFKASSPNGVAHIQHVSVNKMYKDGKFSFAKIDWTKAETAVDYIYRESPLAPSIVQKEIGMSEEPQLIGAPNEALMLLPQNASARAFDPKLVNNANTLEEKKRIMATLLLNNANIQMIYRLNTATENIVGYDDVTKYPEYETLKEVTGPGAWTDAQKNYKGGLYVKVVYGIGSSIWTKGNCYTYVFKLGATQSGGFLVDDNFYDDNGNIFPLPVVRPGDKNPDTISPGDPIFAGSDDIGFTVFVEPWNTTWNGGNDQVPL